MTLASIYETATTSPVENRGIAGVRRALKPAELLEASLYARGMFAHIAKPFIIPPTDEHLEELRLVFDAEGNGLLKTITKFHCLAISAVDSEAVYEYGPGQIAEALAHLSRADMLIGHNIQGFDLPALLKLHDWAPRPECRIIDTLVAGRVILPNLDDLDGQVIGRTKDKAFKKIWGAHSLQAWGVRLGLAKVGTEIEIWAEWTPQMQARCVSDVGINKQLYQFLRPDGYPEAVLDLEHVVAAICERIVMDGVPFDTAAAEQLRQVGKPGEAPLRHRCASNSRLSRISARGSSSEPCLSLVVGYRQSGRRRPRNRSSTTTCSNRCLRAFLNAEAWQNGSS